MTAEILSTFRPMQHKPTDTMHKQFQIKVDSGNVIQS